MCMPADEIRRSYMCNECGQGYDSLEELRVNLRCVILDEVCSNCLAFFLIRSFTCSRRLPGQMSLLLVAE